MHLTRTKAVILMAITAVLWSLGGILIKSVNLSPLAIAGGRSAIASVVIFVAIKKPKFTWSIPQIGAALAYVMLVVTFVSATKMTTATNAIMLQFTAPVYVALMAAWILKEKTTKFDWVIIGVVLSGMVLFFLDKLSPSGFWGNIVAVFSGVAFALFTIFMRMQKDGSPLESVLLGNIFTAIIGLAFLWKEVPTKTDWTYLFILGIVQLGIPYVLYSTAIKSLTALDAVLIPVIEPLLNPIWVFIILREVPGKWSLIGGAIVLTAVTVRCIFSIKKEEAHLSQAT
ncbi:MAG: EamA family transporter [bacterium]|nr:EamA family transporter [bacterium]